MTPKDGEDATAKLKDGRTLAVKVEREAARPSLKVVSMKTEAAAQQGMLPVTLTGRDEIPLAGRLSFVLQSEKPFDRAQRVEVATVSGGAHTELSLQDNTLVLQDEHTAIASLNPQKAFGDSAFGKLQMRPVSGDGTTGAWAPLGTLVRVPEITGIACEAGASGGSAQTCKVEGSKLFLVQAFSGAQDFAKPADVPSGFFDKSFAAPVPADGSTLYLKLRDDPANVATVKLPTPVQPAEAAAPPAQAPAASPTAGQVAPTTTTTPPDATSSSPAPTPVPPAAQNGEPKPDTTAPTEPAEAPTAPATVPQDQAAAPTPSNPANKPQM